MSNLTIVKPNQLPVRGTLTGTEYQIIYADDNDRLERVLISSSGNFITINDVVFRFQKGFTLGVQNTGLNLEINDIISKGIVYVNSTAIEIESAIYTGGDRTNFGNYDDINKDITGGSYSIIEFNKL
jgi:hypothetical protein